MVMRAQIGQPNSKPMKNTAKFLYLFLFLLFSLVLSACDSQPERLWIKTPGWSRAQLMGNTRVGDPVQLAVDKGGNVYLFYIAATED